MNAIEDIGFVTKDAEQIYKPTNLNQSDEYLENNRSRTDSKCGPI